MPSSKLLPSLLVVTTLALASTSRGAAAPAADAPASPRAGQLEPDITAPSVKQQREAIYPPAALAARLESSVGLELHIDARGEVTDAKVVAPAGHGFDEAALAAARAFVFEPARKAGAAIPATVQFAYEFHLPPGAAAAPLPPVAPPAPSTQTSPNQATLVLSSRPISAASSLSVRDREFSLRPIGSVQDILRVTPGLVLVQHSGGGKANQYFLRGFDADHGTDVALSIDGVPINMVSHGHGQGFSDTNFIIPEVVERVEVTKGTYFASQGDFATAGAVNMLSRDEFEHSAAAIGLTGSPGHGALGYRGLAIAGPKMEGIKATFAAEIGRVNGPFDNPENWDRYKLFNKLTFSPSPSATLSLGEMSYSGNWHGSGQIPGRAVEQGLVSRFGSIDPDEGGNSARHQAYLSYHLRPSENSELRALAYFGTYRFNLFSNFTLFRNDPDKGDEIEQVDRRSFYGARVSYRVVRELGGLRLDTSIGGDLRSDDIHEELWHTLHRQQIGALRSNDVHETLFGTYLNQEVGFAPWLRLDLGARADFLGFAVDNQLKSTDPTAPVSGVDGAHQLSPKASLVATPIDRQDAQVDVYVNYGHGFHSNDVRGVFAQPSVTPLTRAIGEEVGSRARLFARLDVALAFWQLDLDNETVWNGDDGTTSVSDATNRKGLEVESRYEFTPWLAADLDLTFTKSQFSKDKENGGGLALAPKQTWSGGLSGRHALGPGAARAGVRFYGIGDRPATDDGELVAPGFTQVDVHLGYRHRWFDIALDIENLLNAEMRSAQFATVGRLRGEPAIGAPVPPGFGCGSNARLAAAPDGSPAAGRFNGCEDIHFTPAYPFTLRVLATLFLD